MSRVVMSAWITVYKRPKTRALTDCVAALLFLVVKMITMPLFYSYDNCIVAECSLAVHIIIIIK